MRVTRGIATLSLTVVAVLGLSACSSDGEAKDRPAAEAGASAPAEEAAESSEFDLTKDDFIQRVTDATQAAGTLTMDMTQSGSGMSQTASGVVSYAEGAQEMSMTLEVPEAGTVEMRMVDGVVYMTMGELTQGKFLEIDPNDPSNPMAGSVAELEGQFDPTQGLSPEAVLQFEKAGEPEEVGGVLAQPYTVVVDSSAAAENLPEELAGAGASLPAELSYTYWIDADDLIRRVTSESLGISTDITFSGWGEPVEIVAPAPEEITDLSSLGL
ncbi:hypothetical protein [Cellulomonas pakistanensis]|uniref:Lipoprotein n=1 Tax=Cellulomonas pakistanensis TaxID=992287 RepID=A0A919U4A5_9CELL|nr:hypothetical protein [Cellulomonas pakistanensis]GIG37271.1 hypothetical protein Cpa01nite_26520 [Cellulomonas pakistanensis]